MRMLQVRRALRDRAPSVRGIQYVLSRRACGALAPGAASADDRAVHGADALVGLVRSFRGYMPQDSWMVLDTAAHRALASASFSAVRKTAAANSLESAALTRSASRCINSTDA